MSSNDKFPLHLRGNWKSSSEPIRREEIELDLRGTTRLKLKALGKLKLASSCEEVDITFDIEGMLRRVVDKTYEAREVTVSVHYFNVDLELMGTICFETNAAERLKSISAQFNSNDDILVVGKQQAQWDYVVAGLNPFSFRWMKKRHLFGSGTFVLPWGALVKLFRMLHLS
jgi:hypothetical protein